VETSQSYPDVPQQPDYPRLEEAMLALWAKERTFEASVNRRLGGSNEYVFYDGPPFANGLPHYGHLLTGFVKDAVPRYQTMRGRRVDRRFGWDCHGLPAEMQAEKELEVAGRAGVETYGIERFNDYCRSLVQRTTDAWEQYVTRQARWVDFVNDYKTMDLSYMESVLWAFSQLYEKGLLYEGTRVLPYCWECETPLSNFETRMDDAYRDREDTAVTVAFELYPVGKAELPEGLPPELAGPLRLLAWTTTPWTLPSNLALAVGPDIAYEVVRAGGMTLVASTGWMARAEDALGPIERLGTVTGSALVGRSYAPLFPFFSAERDHGAFRVLAADFVSTEEGTGVVHLAPGFGEDDQRLCETAGIPVVCPVDDRARFTSLIPPLEGTQVFDANPWVIHALEERGILVRAEPYVHSYPHCWRTDTPLIYRAVTSWFVAVTELKDRLIARNQSIRWIPARVRDGAFGKWLEGARDWSISRNRYWGAPIPVWKSDDPAYPRMDVYGSLDELEADFGVRPRDLHRPDIDELTRPNPDDPTGRATMRRVSDVLDCWFESGSMPFAQLHYPFENAEHFEAHFPADFVVEYVGQTRGWFYTLHVLAVALFDRPAFSNCIAHGIVLGDDGRKLSKRLGNYPDPAQVFDTSGADAMRWFLLSSGVLRGQDLTIEASGFEEAVRQALNPIWNAWYFLTLYANVDGLVGHWRTDQPALLDRYILARSRMLIERTAGCMDAYDLSGACQEIRSFVDALNNWYIRRSRDRFWSPADSEDSESRTRKQDAYDTLHTVLSLLCKVSAPLLPLLTDTIYRGLSGGRSVHLEDWPSPEALPDDRDLVRDMELVRSICSAAHSVRKHVGIRARLPLPRCTIVTPDANRLLRFAELIKDETNVKDLAFSSEVEAFATMRCVLHPSVIGPRLGERTQHVIAAIKRGDWKQLPDGRLDAGGSILEPDEFDVVMAPRDERLGRTLPDHAGIIILDDRVTADLEQEGLARDIVRVIQNARKSAALEITDRIRLSLFSGPEALEAIENHRSDIMAQTLAIELTAYTSTDAGQEGNEEPGARAEKSPRAGIFQSTSTLPAGESLTVSIQAAVPDETP